MKIGIVTVYYTENCGSVLQATELSNKLKKWDMKYILFQLEINIQVILNKD